MNHDLFESLEKVRGVIRTLLSPEGCPWDKKQTPQSLCDYVVEEGFELAEAVRGGGPDAALEELGDVLFLLLFLAELHERAGAFSLADVLGFNAAKMIRRHPHVYGDANVQNQAELLRNWERIKREEKAGGCPGAFDSLPRGLPPLLKAYLIHSKAARLGFTFASDADAAAQFERELAEWREARASGDPGREEREFGDVLFCLVELGRRRGIKANAALDQACRKFLDRYAKMEALAAERGLDLHALDLEAKNALWDEVKAAASD